MFTITLSIATCTQYQCFMPMPLLFTFASFFVFRFLTVIVLYQNWKNNLTKKEMEVLVDKLIHIFCLLIVTDSSNSS